MSSWVWMGPASQAAFEVPLAGGSLPRVPLPGKGLMTFPHPLRDLCWGQAVCCGFWKFLEVFTLFQCPPLRGLAWGRAQECLWMAGPELRGGISLLGSKCPSHICAKCPQYAKTCAELC
jgi:hypothetical protein